MAAFLWVLFAGLAVLDWWALSTGARRVEFVAKPGALLALIGVVLAAAPPMGRGSVLLVAALVLCLAGDILLLTDDDARFVAGLTAFLLGHLAYVALFVTLGLTNPYWAGAGAVLLLLTLPGAARIVAGARQRGAAMAGAVAAYMLVIAAMGILGWATGHALIGLGAILFVVSDTVLGLDRFVQPRPRAGLAVMVTYFAAQAVLVAGALHALG